MEEKGVDTVTLLGLEGAVAGAAAEGEPEPPRAQFPAVRGNAAQFSQDGARVAVLNSGTGIEVFDAASGERQAGLAFPGVAFMQLSPQFDQVLTFQKPTKKDKTERNLKVWDLASGEILWSQFQKYIAKENWPVAFWSEDQTAFLRAVTNEAHVYDPADFAGGIQKRLRLKGIADCSLSPGPTRSWWRTSRSSRAPRPTCSCSGWRTCRGTRTRGRRRGAWRGGRSSSPRACCSTGTAR